MLSRREINFFFFFSSNIKNKEYTKNEQERKEILIYNIIFHYKFLNPSATTPAMSIPLLTFEQPQMFDFQ